MIFSFFKACQGLELQRLRGCRDAPRWLNALQSGEMALNIFLFDCTRFCRVYHRFRRSFRRRKTENSHHVWLTQLHNFHFHRLRATHHALFTALPNVNDVQKMYTDGRRLKYAHKTSFAWVEGWRTSLLGSSVGTPERVRSYRTSCHVCKRQIGECI